jgi:hypothetical protein
LPVENNKPSECEETACAVAIAYPQEANQQARENQESLSASRCAGDHEMATPDTLDRAQLDTTLTPLEGFKTKNNYMNASRCKASMYAQINRDKEAETVV